MFPHAKGRCDLTSASSLRQIALLAEPGAPKHHLLILDTAEANDAFNAAVETFVQLPRKVAHPLVPVQGSTKLLCPSFWSQGLITLPFSQCIWKPCFLSGLRWWTLLSILSHESRLVGFLCPPFSHARFADLLRNVPPFSSFTTRFQDYRSSRCCSQRALLSRRRRRHFVCEGSGGAVLASLRSGCSNPRRQVRVPQKSCKVLC